MFVDVKGPDCLRVDSSWHEGDHLKHREAVDRFGNSGRGEAVLLEDALQLDAGQLEPFRHFTAQEPLRATRRV